MKRLSKAIAIIVALMMCFTVVLTACKNNDELDQAKATAKSTLRSTTDTYLNSAVFTDAQKAQIEGYVTEGNAAIDAATTLEEVAAALSAAQARVRTVVGELKAGTTYTYRVATNSLPTNWNIHTYTSNDATTILDYTEDGFYTFDYNDTKDGYKWALAMASAFPEDVTDEYVGSKWGISQGESWRAIRVQLRDDLYFENGDHITSNDFVESVKLLLNPQAANYRADSLYGGQFSIVGAESYAKGGTFGYSSMIPADYPASAYVALEDFSKDSNGVLYTDDGIVVLNLSSGSTWGDNGLDYYASSFQSYTTRELGDGTVCLQYQAVTAYNEDGTAKTRTILVLREQTARPNRNEDGLNQWGYTDDDGEFVLELLENPDGAEVKDSSGNFIILTYDNTAHFVDTLHRSEKQHGMVNSKSYFIFINSNGEPVVSTPDGQNWYSLDGETALQLVPVYQGETLVDYNLVDPTESDTVIASYTDISQWVEYSWYLPDGTEVERVGIYDEDDALLGYKFHAEGAGESVYVKNASGEDAWDDENLIVKTNIWTDKDGTEVQLVPVWNEDGTEVMGYAYTTVEGDRVDFDNMVSRLDHPYQWYDVDGNKISQQTITVKENDVDVSRTVFVKENGSRVQYSFTDEEGKSVTRDLYTSDLSAVATYNEHYQNLLDAADENGYVKMTEALVEDLASLIAYLNNGSYDWDAYIEYRNGSSDPVGPNEDIPYGEVEWEEFCFYGKQRDAFDFDGVGILAHDEYTLDFIIEKPLSGFYLIYNLSGSMWLVNTELYNQCVGSSQGAYTNSYATSKETYVGFGPYKISSFVSGNKVTLEKNELWYGFKEKTNEAGDVLYQTTNIEISQVSNENTRLNMFLTGQLDSYGLQESDMDTYANSPYTYFTDGDSTFFVALNPDHDGLVYAQTTARPVNSGNSVVKTVLGITEFRQALSFSLDRASYIATLSPAASVAKALYSDMIISDPDNSVFYRDTEEAKDVILKFWGLSDWETRVDENGNRLYETKDEAIESITGLDLAGAKELFTTAYNKAVEAHYITQDMISSGKWEVQIMIGQPGNGGSSYYNNGYELLRMVWTEAVKDTPFEGHLTFRQSQPLGSTTFASYLQNNQVDVLFGVGWTGSTLDPYSLMEAYVSPNYQYDPGWDTTTTTLDITLTINGEEVTLRHSVYAWGYAALQGNAIRATVIENGQPKKDEDGNNVTMVISAGTAPEINGEAVAEEEIIPIRLKILAAVEGAVLDQYDMIPVQTDATASMRSMRLHYYTEEYIFGMGRGGIKYMTYNMSDAEWDAFVRQQGGTLNYAG